MPENINDTMYGGNSPYSINDVLSRGLGGLPSPYKYVVNSETGKLELYKGEELVSSQDIDGSFFREAVSTGVGSFHLGGSESGGLAHSLSSAGQNAGFKNEWTTADEDKKVFWFPVWQGVTRDGSTVHEPSTLYLSGRVDVEPAGAVGGGFMAYDFTTTISEDLVVYDLTVRPLMNYTGKLRNKIYSVVTGAEIYNTEVDVVMVAGEDYLIPYAYPFFTRSGDQLRLVLEDEEGNAIFVYKGTTDNTVPYRNLGASRIAEIYSHEGVHFGIKTSDGDTIEVNGRYLLNNWTSPQPVFTVNPRVDYIELAPWDAGQSGTEYSTVRLPLDEDGSEHITVHYMTNNPVQLFRHKRASSASSRYGWKLKYEGYDYVRALSSVAGTSYDLKAGKRTITDSGVILQGNVTSSWSLDDFVKIGYEITNTGSTVNMYLQLINSGTYETAHTYYNQNAGTTPVRVMGDMTTTNTAFIIDSTSTNGERAFIDTTIHGTSDGSGSWRWKYKGRFTHHSNNNMFWCLEAEYNPRYTV